MLISYAGPAVSCEQAVCCSVCRGREVVYVCSLAGGCFVLKRDVRVKGVCFGEGGIASAPIRLPGAAVGAG